MSDAPRELIGAAGAWLDGLDAGQRERAAFPFDTDERFAWQYTPGDRLGLALTDMGAGQRAAAIALLHAAMSERGAAEAEAIMGLEPILASLERAVDDPMWERRDPERYWFSVFGDPAGDGPWSWRLSGHHVLVQSTVVDGRVAFAPSFLGANPAVVPGGSTAGARALTGEETLARELVTGLSPDRQAIAVVDPVAPPDIRSGHGRRAAMDGIPAGIRHDELDAPGRQRLEGLIRHYLGRAPVAVASEAWERLADGLDGLTFAWAGPLEPRRGHYYAIRGSSILIEYDNTQNDANHIHSVWRDLDGDWGDDLLAAHYRARHPSTG